MILSSINPKILTINYVLEVMEQDKNLYCSWCSYYTVYFLFTFCGIFCTFCLIFCTSDWIFSPHLNVVNSSHEVPGPWWFEFRRWNNQWLAMIIFFKEISKVKIDWICHISHLSPLPIHHYFDIPPSVLESKMGKSPVKIQPLGNAARKM